MNNIINYNILVVDDEKEYQNVVSFILDDAGYNTLTASNGKEALDTMLESDIDLIITDLKMPVMDGIEFIEKAKKINDDIDIIVMTAYGSIESAVEAIKLGALDYFVKSRDLEELVLKVNGLAKINRFKTKSNIIIKNQNKSGFYLESKNEKYIELLEMCRRTADTGINILLLGESGVGKEVIANYIHQLSERKDEPFVPVNCQVFPEGVIESELFGHEKGAFTGAGERRLGRFEDANLGTLFLDEICDLPNTTQGKLLRVLENKSIERIGGNKQIKLDIRFISATNKLPQEEIQKGRFREDLLYRINTLTLNIPPLRERREDLPGLIDFFIAKTEADQKKKVNRIDDSVMEFLLDYDYPGNVRELKNIIERMIALSKDGLVTVAELLMPINFDYDEDHFLNENSFNLKVARSKFEKKYIIEALEKTKGNVTKCSALLGITTRQLWNKITIYEINIDKLRDSE
ncbi:MAG TPA: sigma-54 dependent transcriptional regulator [Anaerovoracaceae bacterium]|nr:sigma-54 dependent transcriptional regulator [Anaerovoracaceae bacterium]